LSYKSLSNSPLGIVPLADVIVIMIYSSVTFNQLSIVVPFIGHCWGMSRLLVVSITFGSLVG